MKERGKGLEVYSNEASYYSSSSDLPCRKHPSSNSVGICAFCLKDRLVKLVCSDCGEQRLSSCSCSDISSNRNSCSVDVGSVGRVSFLIENERNRASNSGSSKPKLKAEEVVVLQRSNSSCVEIKKHGGFWRIGRFFRKRRDKGGERLSVCDEKSDLWMVDYMAVSRSRSLCSFRGGGLFGSEDGADTAFSGGRSSISGARTSSVNGGLVFDSGRRSGFSEAEPRKSGFERETIAEHENDFNLASRRVFSLKESDFNGMDESSFIDFKLDFTSESKAELKMGASDSEFGSMRGGDILSHECGGAHFGKLIGDGGLINGGSCRITVSDKGLKKGRKSLKALRWIFRHPPNWGSVHGKKDEDFMVKN